MKRIVSLGIVLAMIICLLPVMSKDVKAGQYDYSLKFFANGGHIGSATGPETKTVSLPQSAYAAGLECSATRNVAYREGYTFVGWFDASGKQYKSGVCGSPSIVFAHWKKNPEPNPAPNPEPNARYYTLSYNRNGGTSQKIAPQKGVKGATLSITKIVPDRDGRVFLGWSRYKYASCAEYMPEDSFVIRENTVLYAIWY